MRTLFAATVVAAAIGTLVPAVAAEPQTKIAGPVQVSKGNHFLVNDSNGIEALRIEAGGCVAVYPAVCRTAHPKQLAFGERGSGARIELSPGAYLRGPFRLLDESGNVVATVLDDGFVSARARLDELEHKPTLDWFFR